MRERRKTAESAVDVVGYTCRQLTGYHIMRLLIRVLPIVLALGLVCAFVAPAFAAKPAPPGSYMKYSVSSVDELREQVANDSLLRNRYSLHFGVSPEALDEYFSTNLQLITLKQSLKTQCWYVDKKGRTHVKTKTLPKGTKVFATKAGKAVIQASCGNPLRTDLPDRVSTKNVTETIQSENASAAMAPPAPEVETMVLPAPEEVITTAVVMAPPAPAAAATLPIMAPPAMQPIAASAVSIAPIAAAAAAAGSGIGSVLGVLGGLGAVAGLAGGGGGGSHSPPVPEASSLLALLGGLSAMPLMFKLRRK